MDPITLAMLAAGGGAAPPPTIDIFGVAGGGGGGTGTHAGGGGGGEARVDNAVDTPGILSISVGIGGAAARNGDDTFVYDESFNVLKSYLGGGAGGNNNAAGKDGACGGGAGGSSQTNAGIGLGSIGEDGGTGNGTSFPTNRRHGGGGGGLSDPGSNASISAPGMGGDGILVTFAGTDYSVGAGGGGDTSYRTGSGAGGRVNGINIGASSNTGYAALANSGSGGSGDTFPGADGMVVVAYSDQYDEATATGTFTFTQSGGLYIYTFTGNGTLDFGKGATFNNTTETTIASTRYVASTTSTIVDTGLVGTNPKLLVFNRAGSSTDSIWVDNFDGPGALIAREGGSTVDINSSNIPISVDNKGTVRGIRTDDRATRDNTGYNLFGWKVAPDLFDIVSYTGNGAISGTFQAIPHNLGRQPGFVIIYPINSSDSWVILHKDGPDNGSGIAGWQRYSIQGATTTWINGTNVFQDPDDEFIYVGSGVANTNNQNYRAYIWPIEGVDGSGKVVCKSGLLPASGTVDLGFEPNLFFAKTTLNTGNGNWRMHGNTIQYSTRSSSGSRSEALFAGQTTQNSTSFDFDPSGIVTNNDSDPYAFIAWRIDEPDVTTGSEVLHMVKRTGNSSFARIQTGFDVTQLWTKVISTSGTWILHDKRFTDQQYLRTDDPAAIAGSGDVAISYQNNEGYGFNGNFANVNNSAHEYMNYAWRYVPGVFTNMQYVGDGTLNRTIPHNHQVAPEAMLIKCQTVENTDSTTDDNVTDWYWIWNNNGTLEQQLLNGPLHGWDFDWTPATIVTSMDSSSFVVNTTNDSGNATGEIYIANMWSTKAGVCKVGTYVGTGAAGNEQDCGFSNGVRFVLIQSETSGSWYIIDEEHNGGSIPATDVLSLRIMSNNSSTTTASGIITSTPSGFQFSGGNLNTLGENYRFIAIS